MFREYKNLDLIETASQINEFWKKENIFLKSISERPADNSFIFYEGPPSANGKPGIHHAMSRTIKDLFCRYQTQKGKRVMRKAGWDTHGLPVELGVEKELHITKEDIGKTISIEDYNKACKEAVLRYTEEWNTLTNRIGYWVDLETPYVTFSSKYMESVWWLLKEIYKKGLLYKGYTIQPYSPAAGTGLSSHELNMPGTYSDVTDTTIVAQFKAIKESNPLLSTIEGDVYFLAWTTTPWTLPSNTALTVGEKIDYVLIETLNQYTHQPIRVILAKDLVNKQLDKKYYLKTDNDPVVEGKIPYKVIQSFSGKELVGTKYEQLLPWAKPKDTPEKAFYVIADDFVTTEDGTGIVHTAPTFGADDARAARENNIPAMLIEDENGNAVPLVDMQGRFISSLPENWRGKYVKNEYYPAGKEPEKSVDVEIAILLKENNRAFHVEKYTHSYPHCWRTDKPILYYPLDSWFIKVTDEKEKLINNNQKINWKPGSTGTGRFGNWLENANDWNLSRSRFWGIPLPIWRTEDGTEEKIIGSVAELIKEIEHSISRGVMTQNPFENFELNNMSDENYAKIDLHKNIVDSIILASDTGAPMKRETDLIDVWFDSGAMPYAQYHYPFENKEWIDNHTHFPADFIAEGVDQTRGWFYTLHVISNLIFNEISYKNVISNGLVLDKDGQKMSKRLGNTIDPNKILDQYGPDALRWYMISNALPWDNLKFDSNGIDEVRKKFFGTLYNIYSFFALYANVDTFTGDEPKIDYSRRSELDQWILSELHSLIKEVDLAYQAYEPTKAARLISDFVIDNLSNWYVRLSRRVFWKGEYTEEKIAAYQTLYECLLVTSQLMAPIAPFFADRLYQDLTRDNKKIDHKASVHLTDFPVSIDSVVNHALEDRTRLAQKVTSLALSIRKKENIKVRQPLQKIMIPVSSEKIKADLISMQEIIKQEINVKEVLIIDSHAASNILVKQIKPNYKALGPKHGKQMKHIGSLIEELHQESITALETGNAINLQVGGVNIELLPTDVEISTKDIPGWSIAGDGKITVALDLIIDQKLEMEGLARELVNRIQTLRKESDLDVTDKIDLYISGTDKIKKMIEENKQYICEETLTKQIYLDNHTKGNGKELEINNEFIFLDLKKVETK